jgi:hypothetical protein
MRIQVLQAGTIKDSPDVLHTLKRKKVGGRKQGSYGNTTAT